MMYCEQNDNIYGIDGDDQLIIKGLPYVLENDDNDKGIFVEENFQYNIEWMDNQVEDKEEKYIYVIAAINVLLYKLTGARAIRVGFYCCFDTKKASTIISTVIERKLTFYQLVEQIKNCLQQERPCGEIEEADLFFSCKKEYKMPQGQEEQCSVCLNFYFQDNVLHMTCFYSDKKYTKEYIRYFLENVSSILTQVATEGNFLMKEFCSFPHVFRQQEMDLKGIDSIIDIIDQVSVSNEKKIAIEDGKRKVSYAELKLMSDSVAVNLLENENIGKAPIGIIAEPCIEYLFIILGILKAGIAFVPISVENPTERILDILNTAGCNYYISFNEELIIEAEAILPLEKQQLLIYRFERVAALEDPLNCVAYIMFTSGSTGRPKGVKITMGSLSNYLLWAKEEYCADFQPIMPLFTSIGVDLTITSTFLPLLCGGKIQIYTSNNSMKKLAQIVADDKVNMIKLTPSHLKLLNEMQETNISLRKIIVGGEALNRFLVKKTQKKYNNTLSIFNEYGPTEATVGCMCYQCNEEKDKRVNISLGTPIKNSNIYVLDRDFNPVSVYGMGELFIGGLCLSEGYINNKEMNQKLFLENIVEGEGKVYRTGDIVKILPNNGLEYHGRCDEQVKIRGMRVEMSEVERVILQLDGIRDVLICADKGSDSLIAVIECDVENHSQTDIADKLANQLPDFMIPNRILLIESMPINQVGKKDLSMIIDLIGKKHEFVKPRDETEKELWKIWSEVLGHETFGVEDDFFMCGGHSLSVAALAGKIYAKFAVVIELGDFFDSKTICEQANLIRASSKDYHYELSKSTSKKYYNVSYSQGRMYIFSELNKDSIVYNTPTIFIIEGTIDTKRVEEAIRGIIYRQNSLRTSFQYKEGQIKQVISEEVIFNLDVFEICQGEEDELINNYVRPFDLSKSSLLRVALAKYIDRENQYLLILDMHHIITDGLSMHIFVDEFCQLYNGNPMKELNLQYTDFSEWQHNLLETGYLEKQIEYWQSVFCDKPKEVTLPVDFNPENMSYKGKTITFEVSEEIASKVEKFCRLNGVTLHMFLVSVFSVVINKWCNAEDVVIGTSTSGRIHEELHNIIGVFINMIPVRMRPQPDKIFMDYIEEVKIATIKGFENSEIPIDMIRNLLPKMHSHNLLDITFTTQDFGNVEVNDYRIKDMFFYPYEADYKLCHAKLNMMVSKTFPRIKFNIEYSTELFKEETILALKKEYRRILGRTLANPYLRIGDI